MRLEQLRRLLASLVEKREAERKELLELTNVDKLDGDIKDDAAALVVGAQPKNGVVCLADRASRRAAVLDEGVAGALKREISRSYIIPHLGS